MKQFLPFITDDQGRSLKLDNGTVVPSSIPDPLNNSPEGWESNTLQWARNKEFFGIIKSYTTSLKFYKDAATILRNAFYRLGMETVLFFIWLKQNVTFGAGMKYEGWYKGEPDFSTFKDEWDGVEMSIVEGGFFKDLQANKAIVYEVPFDEDAKYVYMDGMFIHQSAKYQIFDYADPGTDDYGQHSLNLTLLSTETSQSGPLSQDRYHFTNNTDLFANIQPFLITGVASETINISTTFKVRPTLADGITPNPLAGSVFLIRAFNPSGVVTDVFVLDSWGGASDYYNILHQVNVNTSITVPANSRLFALMFLTIGGVIASGSGADEVVAWHYEDDNNYYNLDFTQRSAANLVPILRAFDYGKKLITDMSTGATFQSPLLENDYNLMVASGDSLRNIPNAVLKGTFSDYFKSIDAVKCAALDIVNNIPVLSSRYDRFNKASVISNLGSCSNWTLEPATDYIYDSVESGYPSKSAQADNDVNGKYSFNNTYEWKVDVTRPVVNKYECKAAYYADPYDIELLRIQFLEKDTTTANTDNSIFFLDCEPKTDLLFSGGVVYNATDNTIELTGDTSTFKNFIAVGIKLRLHTGIMPLPDAYVDYTVTEIVILSDTSILFKVAEYIIFSTVTTGTVRWINLYQLRRKTYTTINGIINDGTVFNIELSPRRCLQNHLRWLRSSFDHLDMQYLKFLSTDKNANLQTIDADGNTITEKADIQIGTMGEKVFLPYLAKFNVKSPYNLLELMNANHDGVFQYSFNGVDLDGFPIQIATNDAQLSEQEYTLLCSANNNLNLLINNR